MQLYYYIILLYHYIFILLYYYYMIRVVLYYYHMCRWRGTYVSVAWHACHARVRRYRVASSLRGRATTRGHGHDAASIF